MKNRSLFLFIILLFGLLSAAKYTLSIQQELKKDYYYSLIHVLEDIPELDVRVMDATDISVSRLGRTSIGQDVCVLYFNGVRVAQGPGGAILESLRPFCNSEIDTITVYTGTDALIYPGNFSVVIDVKAEKLTKNSIGGLVYVGSEVGDPAIYLHLLTDDIPYNKEQLAAGELLGTLKTGALLHSAGVSMAYMDRYSNRYESERNVLFDEKNSNSSMSEVRKGTYALQYLKGRYRNYSHISGVDYNLFRYDQFYKRYHLFEGQRGSFHQTNSFNFNKLESDIYLHYLYDNYWIYSSHSDSVETSMHQFSFTTNLKYDLNDDWDLTLSVEASNVLNHDDVDLPDSFSITTVDKRVQTLAGFQWKENLIEVQVGYPLLARVKSALNLNDATLWGGILLSGKEDPYKKSAYLLSSEVGFKKRVGGAAHLTSVFGYERAPEIYTGSEGISFGFMKHNLWAQSSIKYKEYFYGSFYSSQYLLKGSVGTTFNVRGLTIGGGFTIKSATYWDSNNRQLLLSQKERAGVYTVKGTFRGKVEMTYSLFNEHLRLAIAMRDIGPVSSDLPQGSLVGPVIASNILFDF